MLAGRARLIQASYNHVCGSKRWGRELMNSGVKGVQAAICTHMARNRYILASSLTRILLCVRAYNVQENMQRTRKEKFCIFPLREQMQGNILNRMAEGIESSAVILICVTRKYMEKVAWSRHMTCLTAQPRNHKGRNTYCSLKSLHYARFRSAVHLVIHGEKALQQENDARAQRSMQRASTCQF